MQSPTKNLTDIFGLDRRLTVPLFQRRYVWTRERQWDRLWDDIAAVADAFAVADGDDNKEKQIKPHFLGAIVLDGAGQTMEDVQVWQIIDGQQRLTTTQMMLEAFSDLCREHGQTAYHEQMLKLTRVNNPLITEPDAVFKLWPTTADQEHFRNVMVARNAAELCRRYGLEEPVESVNDPLADAYLFFFFRIEEWLRPKDEGFEARLKALYKALRLGVRFVTIELDEKDDAQVIFETLNAHGTPLLVADLVKNYLFHKVKAGKEELGNLYAKHWKHFDDHSKFWTSRSGRGVAAREMVDAFLQYYLVARTRKEVQVGHLFSTFREHATSNGAVDAKAQLSELQSYAEAFRGIREAVAGTRQGDFFERIDQMEVGPAYPFILELVVNKRVPRDELLQCMADIESFLVRRMVCGLTAKHYNRLFVEAMAVIGDGPGVAGRLQKFLLAGDGDAVRWPQFSEFEAAWLTYPLYRKLRRRRIGMLLKAIEQQLYDAKAEVVVSTKKLQVEHLLPRKWQKHWPLPDAPGAEERREELLHTIGNLTLLTQGLNVTNSNLGWEKKRKLISKHGALALNRQLVEEEEWDEKKIGKRAAKLLAIATRIWPHPADSRAKGK